MAKMTEKEKIDLLMEIIKLDDEGREDEADELFKAFPISSHMLMAAKKIYGPDWIIENGYNTIEAEEKYGPDWIK